MKSVRLISCSLPYEPTCPSRILSASHKRKEELTMLYISNVFCVSFSSFFLFFFNHKTRRGSCGSRWAEQQKPHDTSLRLLGWWRLSGAAFKFWEVRAVSSRTGGARHQHPGFAVSRQPHSPRKPAKVSLQLAREAALLQAGFCG